MQYLVIFKKAADGAIRVKVLDLNSFYSFTDTIDEAKKMKETIALCLEDLKEEGKPILLPGHLADALVAI